MATSRSLTGSAGQEIALARSEFGLLTAFVQRPGRDTLVVRLTLQHGWN